MAINARTFQLLYITRQRALKDLPTKVKDMSTFINKRRKANPSMYEKAYLAPASIRDMVQRMTTGEGLLTIADEGNLELTVRGSQMADLLSEIDACSTFFHADWKKAHLQGSPEAKVSSRSRAYHASGSRRHSQHLTGLRPPWSGGSRTRR